MADNQTPFQKALWIDGTLYLGSETETASIPMNDRGLLLGDGLFETLPILKGTPIWWNEHRTRLSNSAEQIGMRPQQDKLNECVAALSRINETTNAILRVTLTRGTSGRGLAPASECEGFLFASVAPLPETMAFDTLDLITSSIRKNERSPTASLKSLNYLDHILAADEATKAGAGDALLLNTKGMVSCSTIGNVFAVLGKTIVTPPIADGVLPGIMRGKILAGATDLGLQASEASLTPIEIKKADGLFLTNSLRIIRRVSKLDDVRFPLTASEDDVIARLMQHFRRHLEEMTCPRS